MEGVSKEQREARLVELSHDIIEMLEPYARSNKVTVFDMNVTLGGIIISSFLAENVDDGVVFLFFDHLKEYYEHRRAALP